MASSASTKDLSKAINAFLPTPTLPLPDELAQVIEGYLEKHEKYDDAAADRLHEELMLIYHKSVQDHPARYAPFLAILRQLRPAVKTSERFIQWWDKLVEPVLDHLGHEKGLASEAIASTIDILTADDANQDNVTPDSGSLQLANRLLGKWMHLYQITQPEGKSAQGFKEKLLRETVLQFAKKRPKRYVTGRNGSDNAIHYILTFTV
ncbi:putative tuberous sclerosis 1 protein [Phaeoacremonium minimum UCRPA7]|uniref:Putative tuberous sclerosis 1 protein n=1 Tax=Phaeoacremonium minimum (strain UCR-PA7) TaxID=1286976 RepID=R8BX17_PHAM7|nr:putative tuberous sclerosis 1 protein [Phaeoacremonium minimum UCRPA7]EOO03865.1 putative tuberous sclerosis 1 protein [Phaeoacremonium minimum UCRPA7]